MQNVEVRRMAEKVVCTEFMGGGNDWSQSILLASDQHFDSTHCDRDLLKKHLEEARATNSLVFFLGDWFDAMQGRSDKRGNKSGIRPEYKRSDYLNALIEETCEFLEPYAANIAVWAEGNHETAIEKYTELNLLSCCIRELSMRAETTIQPMGYTGWIYLRPMRQGKRKKAYGTVRMAYTHGTGGGVVTRGSLNVNRRSIMWPDADIIASGHIHESFVMEVQRERVSDQGTLYQDTQWHLQLPSYKDEFSGDGSGWWHETGKSPRPKGAWWLDLKLNHTETRCEVQINPRRAI